MTGSPRLSAFVAEAPLERELILAVVREAAAAAPPGARVLDAGAGDAPYRELFAHTDYKTTDWAESVHEGARRADIIASLDALPVPDASFDVALCTQVLEHVPEPAAVLAELRRVLRPGGELWLTVPFVGELHEEPHDHYRYTSHGLRGLCERAGFGEVRTWPLGGYFTAMAQLARNCGLAIGAGTGRGELGRRAVAAGFRAAGSVLPRLDRLDRRRALPIGFACRAVAQPASTRS
jgi:SAM-dependent methyltransferase